MKVIKIESQFSKCDIAIETDDKSFEMYFGGNGDLYWTLYLKNQNDSTSFEINKDNPVLYNMFDQLFNRIKECNIHKTSKKKETKEELEKKEWLKRNSNYSKLFHDNMITWHCDDQIYDEANIVSIIPKENSYLIQFDFKNNDMFLDDSIRFRNSGSTYTPFNIVFMDLFMSLQNYDFEHDVEGKKLIKKI